MVSTSELVAMELQNLGRRPESWGGVVGPFQVWRTLSLEHGKAALYKKAFERLGR